MNNIIKARLRIKAVKVEIKQLQSDATIETLKNIAMTLCVCAAVVFATWVMS